MSKIENLELFENNLSVDCAQYIADYINEEVMRGKSIDFATILGALVAYQGGAGEMS